MAADPDPDADDAARFITAFHDVFAALHRRSRPGERQLGPEAWSVLEHLAVTGPLTVTEAARHFGRSQSATTELLQRLVRRGLVETFPDQRDRRRTLAWFTAAGHASFCEGRHLLDAARVRAAFDRLSPTRKRTLVAALGALARMATGAAKAAARHRSDRADSRTTRS